MSESMTVEQKMARSVETWRKCDPILMASQSQAALTFAFRDMKRDILVLADEVERLRNAEKSLAAFSGDVLGSADSVIQRLSEERGALQARVAELEAWERFVPYLIDNHEKEVVYEESIQRWLAEMLDKEKANQIEGGA